LAEKPDDVPAASAELRMMLDLFDRINAAIRGLGPEPYANINRLTRLCGELLGADAAVYYRKQKDSLFAIGRWGLPDDFNAVVSAHSPCLDNSGAAAFGIYVREGEDLGEPACCNISCVKLGVKTCVGCSVISGDGILGQLCALYRSAYAPHPLHERIMGLVAGALAVEEERLRMERASQKLSEELRQSQKMEAIGLLAGGVAHDFNNALTSIRGNAEMLLERKDLPEEARDEAAEISKSAVYAASLTRQLLTFSRKQIMDSEIIDLNATVTNLAQILRRTVGENIAIDLQLAEGADCIRADPGQIEQVIMNLAINARDAMPQGGRLLIGTGVEDLSGPEAPAAIREKPGRYVALSVCDTGIGMTPDVLARLYEPFFTTKDVGKGTGLGLSTVYGIVRQSGGDITVDSEFGKGSTFTVHLPAVAGETAAPRQADALAGLLSSGETILLVEDEAQVRTIVARILRNANFKVYEARHGREALSILEQGRTIDLLVTDIVMPEMSGYQLAQEVRKKLPALAVLFMSGYADEATLKAASSSENAAIMMKPFTPTEMLRRIRALMRR